MHARTCCLMLACCALTAQAADYVPREPEQWERENAWRLSSSAKTRAHEIELLQRVRAGDSGQTLASLQAVDQDPDLSAPARERLLFEFVNALRHEPPQAVDQRVMQYLAEYPSTVYVPHEDHPRTLVPLFSIGTVTAGVVHGWTREESALRGSLLLARDARELVERYVAATHTPEQRGLLDAMVTATPAQRDEAASVALEGLNETPALAELVGTAALLNEDALMMERLLTHARAEGLHRLLRESARRFEADLNAHLLFTALDQGEPGVASLAIAELAPALMGHAATLERLFVELSVPATGAAAALALAGSADPAVLTR
ncbi:MAG: hypothetical protein HKN15_01005, partial [Xanthomonadales bacterium]|nr:hypothetical protein [Xanthomonadales bacterium]